jgi:hypothetical protein
MGMWWRYIMYRYRDNGYIYIYSVCMMVIYGIEET